MRNKILFTLTALLLMATGMRAQTPYAVYVYDSDSNSGTLTFKYVENKLDGQFVYELNDEWTSPDWLDEHSSDITKVVFDPSFQAARPTTCYQWFYGFENLTTIEGLGNLNTSSVTDMSYMFSGCKNLPTLDLSSFDTSNVTYMIFMFFNCNSLKEIAFGDNFDTSNVTYMSYMFSDCENLPTLDLSSFDTSNVTDMSFMFHNCNSLKEIAFGDNFDTSNVTDMSYMFSGCTSLESLDLSYFNTANVTNMSYMFSYCYNLETIYVSDKFKIDKVTSSDNMFDGSNQLKNYDESCIDNTYAHYNTGGYFTYFGPYATYNESAKTLTFKYDKNKPEDQEGVYELNEGTNEPGWYEHHSYITTVVFDQSFEDARPTTCYKWFIDCIKLTEIRGLENLNTENVKDMSYMFNTCWALPSIDFSNFNTSNVTNMKEMFYGCESLKSLNLKSFDTANVTDMSNMFNGCNTLRLLDLSKATIDFYKFEFESEITENVLIYVPAGTEMTADRKNVVVGSTCKHFVLDVAKDDNQLNNQLLLSIPYGFTAKKVTINREFTKGTPYTLYLPFAMNATEHGSFYTYSEYDANKVTFSKLTDEQTTANTPYLFKPEQNYDNGIVIERESGITVETTPEKTAEPDEAGLCGVYAKKTFTEAEANKGIYYGWAGGDFKRAGKDAKVDACRAYLKLPASNAPARLSVKFEDENTTGIINIEREDSGTESPIYNLNGQRVGSSYRGVVIKNGKKIVNRAQ